MRPKSFALVVIILVVLAGIGIWLGLRMTEISPEKTLAVPISVKSDAPMPGNVGVGKNIASPAMAAPIAPPVPNPVAALPVVAPSSDANADSRIELTAAFADIARLYRAGNLVGEYQTHTQPDKVDPKQIQNWQEMQQVNEDDAARSPDFKQFIQQMFDRDAEAYEALENETPTFNAAGDEATYDVPASTTVFAPDNPIVFVKINGKWYRKQE